MQFGTWDTLFNLILMIFWFRIWTSDNRTLYFNPYLAPIARVSESVINFLRPVFFATSPRIIAAISLVFLIAFRGMIFHGIAVSREVSWALTLGIQRQADTYDRWTCLIFSTLSFAVFLFKLWGFSLIYVRTRGGSSSDHTTDSINHLARPFTGLRVELRPLVLLVFGIVLVSLLDVRGTPPQFVDRARSLAVLINRHDSTPVILFLKLSIAAMAGWVSVLTIIVNFMILLIIGSWVSMFTSSQGVMMFCREWLDMLIGPIRRYPIRIGMLDLTSIVFFFVVSFVHQVLMGILYSSYLSL